MNGDHIQSSLVAINSIDLSFFAGLIFRLTSPLFETKINGNGNIPVNIYPSK